MASEEPPPTTDDEVAPEPPSHESEASADTQAGWTVPEQPWLRIEFDAENDLDAPEPVASEDRLISGLQGLLEPVRISSRGRPRPREESPEQESQRGQVATATTSLVAQSGMATLEDLTSERQRILRRLMSEPPIVRNRDTGPVLLGSPRIAWIILFLLAAVLLPFLVNGTELDFGPVPWSGIEDAYLAIQGLPTESTVLIYWAYDPATAGELDLLARTVTGHLLDRHASTIIVSPLPLGPPVARRVLEQARTQQGRNEDLRLIADLTWEPPIRFLPGGKAVLPLVAHSLEQIVSSPLSPPPAALRYALEQTPALHVLLAAQAEDVQDWIEQVQPFTSVRTIAATSAAADPILRPYLDSGQLHGLVSGFDGALQYQTLVDDQYRRHDTVSLYRHTLLQGWGHIAILVLIVIGNLVSLFTPRRR